MPHALLVEDDPVARKALANLVERLGFSTATAQDLADARRELAHGSFDAVVLDVHLPGGSGIDLLLEIPKARRPQVVLTSGDESVRAAFASLPLDELHFVQKPVDVDELERVLRAVRRRTRPEDGADDAASAGGSILGASGPIRRVRALIAKVAPTELAVYVEGESGTGKELVARAIHDQSPRRDAPFVAINCGALPENLIDSELFGHEKGAFTGADAAREGVFEQAHGGTLFLDEIAEMPTELQVRLLRTLETSAVRRVGGKTERPVDVRVVSATNRPFDRAIADGALREDLFHRLCVFPIAVPPLRDRGDDVVLLARAFLREFGAGEMSLTERVVEALRRYAWPGNVRQLRNAMQRAAVLADGDAVTIDCLPDPLLAEVGEAVAAVPDRPAAAPAPDTPAGGLGIEVGVSIAEAERRLIEATLARMGGDKRSTAEVLGVSLRTLYNRLKDYASDD